MGVNLATVDAILKIDYHPPVREQLVNTNVLLKHVRKTDKNFVGKVAYVPLSKGRNAGIGARGESIQLPAAGAQIYDKAQFYPAYLYGSISLTGPSMAAAKNDKGAFVRLLQAEMKGLVKDMRRNLSRQLWHDGSSILTRCGVTANATTVVVESTKFLKEWAHATQGALVDIVTIANGNVVGASRRVTGIVSETEFTIDGAGVTTAATEAVILNRTRLSPQTTPTGTWGLPVELWGLEAIIALTNPGNGLTSKFGDIDRSAAAGYFWKSNVLANGAVLRDLDLDLMQLAYDTAEIEGDADPGLILTNHAIKRRYAALLQADKRYPAGGEITLDGGYKALEFNETPLVADRDASKTLTPQVLNGIYFLTMSTMEMQVLEDFGWLDKDGSVLKHVAQYDQWEAHYAGYMNLACDRPNANVLLTDIRETA